MVRGGIVRRVNIEMVRWWDGKMVRGWDVGLVRRVRW